MEPSLLNVSRETSDLFREYEALVRKWTPKINLIAPATLKDFPTRHIRDSLQCFDLMTNVKGNVVDLGSGAGLPGLVVAIMAKTSASPIQVELVESDKRKAVFLKTVCRSLELNTLVTNDRIENLPPRQAACVTSRALAPLPNLLGYLDLHMASDGVAFVHKGKNWGKEVAKAKEKWSFDAKVHRSIVENTSVVLEIRNIHNV